jgi:hypothetical protein
MKDEMVRACSTNLEKRTAYGTFVGKQIGKRPLGRQICKWLNNIKMDVKRDRMGWY